MVKDSFYGRNKILAQWSRVIGKVFEPLGRQKAVIGEIDHGSGPIFVIAKGCTTKHAAGCSCHSPCHDVTNIDFGPIWKDS